MSLRSIKKNDTVIALAGVSAGRTGKVLEVLPSKGRAIVEGLNMVKKTVRKSQDNPRGGIIEKENAIEISNLMQYCPQCKKGVRINAETEGDRKIRKCRRCNHSFDA